MPAKRSRAWTPDELASYYAGQGKKVPEKTIQLLAELGLSNHARLPKAADLPVDAAGATVKTKRRGVKVAPLVKSLNASLVFTRTQTTPVDRFSTWFDGARLLTANEMIQVLQTRPQAMYAYKKACRLLMERAVKAIHPASPVPFFDGPTRISLYRRGAKLVDLDALPVMFKYIVDAMRKEGVIADDNPEILVETRLLQEVGEPALAIRLERLEGWEPESLEGLKQRWLEPGASV